MSDERVESELMGGHTTHVAFAHPHVAVVVTNATGVAPIFVTVDGTEPTFDQELRTEGTDPLKLEAPHPEVPVVVRLLSVEALHFTVESVDA